MGTITRTVQSTASKEISTANYQGWSLTFTVESNDDGPLNVSVQAQKNNRYMSGNADSSQNISVNFSSGGYDPEIATAVAAEMETILAGTETEEGE